MLSWLCYYWFVFYFGRGKRSDGGVATGRTGRSGLTGLGAVSAEEHDPFIQLLPIVIVYRRYSILFACLNFKEGGITYEVEISIDRWIPVGN